jgi:hypothetical protein
MKKNNYSNQKKVLKFPLFLFNQSLLFILLLIFLSGRAMSQTPLPVTPPEWRGTIDAEREGLHDANLIRTLYKNYGMVGSYPADEGYDPLNVDLSIFHSVEIPKGSGQNYSDGTTPFVLARVLQANGNPAYIMETGYRERQGTSPYTNREMRFEPRFGYFQIDPAINTARAPAISNDPRTWPDEWYDKLNDPDDPGWRGSWNGYFGKAPRADQESFIVYDDNFYDAWSYWPDTRDNTRRGLGLKVEQRGFQWSNPQASYVIFFHYDIANESTTRYENNVIFGLYMDSGVGGSGIGPDGVPESDDDNAFYDREAGLNLVYTWDKGGTGMRGPTGYLGYSYLETPGNPFDGIDNDQDGITDERRNSGPGEEIIGQDAIMNYVMANYDLEKFEAFYGPITSRPAFITGVWWTGDEDMDWVAEFHDTGADGVFGTNDTGEEDGRPTNGEPNFDRTDIDESDMIGLTGFKMNRIRAGVGNPSTEVDQIVFFDDGRNWPRRLFNIFTDPDSAFDVPLVLNYNIGFLFASGPFILDIGTTERFSLAMGFGQDLRELRVTTQVVQQIYKANYQFAVPPPMPVVEAYAGDGFVTLTWGNISERAFDPITSENDFEGYRIYRSTDPTFLDPQVILTGTGTRPIGNGRPIAQFDLINGISGFSQTTVEGVAYFLGEDTGITHSFTDSTVTNGQRYFYAVCAYDRGVDSVQIYPSENAITVSQTLRGGIILPTNVVEVTPNPPVPGYKGAEVFDLTHSEGKGTGNIELKVLNSELVPEDHLMQIEFINHIDSARAQTYILVNTTSGDTLFTHGEDFNGEGTGPAGAGVLPVISTSETVQIDSQNTQMVRTSGTNIPLTIRYSPALPVNFKRPGYPENIDVIFSDEFIDTSVAGIGAPSKPVKFTVIAKTDSGDYKLRFRFRDNSYSNDNTLSSRLEYIEILTASRDEPNILRPTWRLEVDTVAGQQVIPPRSGDVYNLRLILPYSSEDKFTFLTKAHYVDPEAAKTQFSDAPYVVPNPYVGAASFEPQRFAVSGRGERKIEFRNLPANCTIRIYTLTGELVQILHHSGDINKGVVAWNLRNRDQLEIAPGLYLYHVDGGSTGTYVGKFAIIK